MASEAEHDVCYVHDGPQREIGSAADVQDFLASPSFALLFGHLERLNRAVRGCTLRERFARSEGVDQIVALLSALSGLVESFPPTAVSNSRFGNPAFREWHDAACRLIRRELSSLVPLEYWVEVAEYLTHAIGDRQRIDYGTGHEAHFLAFLYCLDRIGVLGEADDRAVVLAVFHRYLQLMRLVQERYWLEPAGSLGVWGLDDYHFLPFLFGASQLAEHEHFRPKSIHDPEIVGAFRADYLYFEAIAVILRVKGPRLHEHSPMLDDISAVRSWDKVNSGLVKMYRAEVFSKLPVMQHFLFGRLLPFKSAVSRDPDAAGHIHQHQQQRGDCCGNPLPSAFPQARDNLRGLSSFPFD